MPQITVTRDGQTVPGTSIMGLMMLAAPLGTTIHRRGDRARRRRRRWTR